MPSFHRRAVLAVLGALGTLIAGSVAAADAPAPASSFPTKPITIIVGSSAGSTTDGLARQIAQEITVATHVPVIVDNRAGANGGIAAQYVAKSAPDGYTVFMTTNSTQAANQHLYRKLPYDPVKDFAPVGALVKGYMLMVVNPSVKVSSAAEFIAAAKAQPAHFTFGAGSSSARVAVELMQQMSGTKLVYVPYKANPPAIIDLVGGQVDMMIVDLTTSLPQVKAGKLKALGVSSATRSPLVPDLPTLSETGLPGYELSFWNALYAPAGTPPALVRRLDDLMQNAMKTPAVLKFVAQNGMEPFLSTPAELASFQPAETQRWGRIINAAGIEPE